VFDVGQCDVLDNPLAKTYATDQRQTSAELIPIYQINPDPFDPILEISPIFLARMATKVYYEPITVSNTKTIKAIACASGMDNSDVATATYTIDYPTATPIFDPPGGYYDSAFRTVSRR